MIAQFSSASPVEAPRCGSATTRGWFLIGIGREVADVGRTTGRHRAPPSTAASSTIWARAKFRITLPRAHQLDARRVDQAARVVVERHVHGDDVGAREQVVQAERLLDARRELPRALHGDLRVVAQHLHAQDRARRWRLRRRWRRARPRRACDPAIRSRRISSCPSPSPLRARDRRLRAHARSPRPGRCCAPRETCPASTSSFTALALAPGALKTGMPRWLSFATGMLLVPAPARATASTLAGISIECTSAERTRIASGCADLRGDFVAVARQSLEAAHARCC